MLSKETINNGELGFTIVATVTDHRVTFQVYSIFGWSGQLPLWSKQVDGESGFTENFDEADLFLHGEVSWDGISDWYFDEQNRAMIHIGSRAGIEKIGKVLLFCWDLAAKRCPD